MGYSRAIDQRAAARRHYEANKRVYKDRAKAHNAKAIKRNRRIVRDHLKAHPCIDCGEDDPDVLDFDHVRGQKVDNVTTMVANCVSAEKLLREIEKCEIRCSNCHRKATKKRRTEKKQKLREQSVRVKVSIQLELFG